MESKPKDSQHGGMGCEAADSRDLLLDEFIELWGELSWWRKKQLAIAAIINREMEQFANMRKSYAGYAIAALYLVSISGLIIFIVRDNALMSAAFGGMLAFTIMVSLYYLVWRYLR